MAQTVAGAAGQDIAIARALLQRYGLWIVAILDHRQVAAQFLNQMDQLGHLLLRQEVDLQVQMSSLASEF